MGQIVNILVFVVYFQGTSYLDTYIRRAENDFYKIIINEPKYNDISDNIFNGCLSIRMGLFGER